MTRGDRVAFIVRRTTVMSIGSRNKELHLDNARNVGLFIGPTLHPPIDLYYITASKLRCL